MEKIGLNYYYGTETEQLMDNLNCGKDKGIRLFNELIEIGLIERPESA